jgi:hypothetical protein
VNEIAAKPLCARCRVNPTLGALSVCKPCLRRQVDAERKERERRMRQMTKERRQVRRVVR